MLHRFTQTEPVDLVKTSGWHTIVHLTTTATLYSGTSVHHLCKMQIKSNGNISVHCISQVIKQSVSMCEICPLILIMETLTVKIENYCLVLRS